WREKNREKVRLNQRRRLEQNPEKERARQRDWYRANAAKILEGRRTERQAKPRVFTSYELQTKYGISLEQYEEMLARQGGGCAVCGTQPGKQRLDVDHCHETGVVRGLLCRACNVSLGALKEDPER